jgi:hypothetical protein
VRERERERQREREREMEHKLESPNWILDGKKREKVGRHGILALSLIEG